MSNFLGSLQYLSQRLLRRGPQNLLTLLPEVFTRDEADRIRKQEGLGTKGTAKMISQWKSRGYILQLTVDSFQNLRFKG